MKDYVTFNAGVVGNGMGGGVGVARFSDAKFVRRVNDSAIASGCSFLVAELEKREPDIKQPLTSVTYTRDVPIKVGGGWVEFVTALNIDYGVTGGAADGAVAAAGANGSPIVQMNLEKDKFGTHLFSSILRVPFVDMQRAQVPGRSLDALLSEGIRLVYDKHMDANAYIGLAKYGTHGLLNDPNVTVVSASTGAQSSTAWSDKTPDEILADINGAIVAVWAAGGYDLSALPNHILIPHAQYNVIATTKVSQYADKTILEFLLDNNLAKRNGGNLVIAGCPFCAGAGAGGADRMAVYCHNERFLAMEELVPLHRAMTQPNVSELAYDSVYMANVSELEMFYTQTVRYVDGI